MHKLVKGKCQHCGSSVSDARDVLRRAADATLFVGLGETAKELIDGLRDRLGDNLDLVTAIEQGGKVEPAKLKQLIADVIATVEFGVMRLMAIQGLHRITTVRQGLLAGIDEDAEIDNAHVNLSEARARKLVKEMTQNGVKAVSVLLQLLDDAKTRQAFEEQMANIGAIFEALTGGKSPFATAGRRPAAASATI